MPALLIAFIAAGLAIPPPQPAEFGGLVLGEELPSGDFECTTKECVGPGVAYGTAGVVRAEMCGDRVAGIEFTLRFVPPVVRRFSRDKSGLYAARDVRGAGEDVVDALIVGMKADGWRVVPPRLDPAYKITLRRAALAKGDRQRHLALIETPANGTVDLSVVEKLSRGCEFGY